MDPEANLAEQIELATAIVAAVDAEEYIGIEDVLEDANHLAELVLALNEWKAKGGFEPAPVAAEPSVRCSSCGSTNVHIAMWVNPNTNEIGEGFGTFNQEDSAFCLDCEKHGTLESVE